MELALCNRFLQTSINDARWRVANDFEMKRFRPRLVKHPVRQIGFLVSGTLQCSRVVHLIHLAIVPDSAEPKCIKNLHRVERPAGLLQESQARSDAF